MLHIDRLARQWRDLPIEKFIHIAVITLTLTLAQCTIDDAALPLQDAWQSDHIDRTEQPIFGELIDQGITQYLGLSSPMTATFDGDTTTVYYGPGDGPLCINGTLYRLSYRNTGSPNLVIFLEGGGACWSGMCKTTNTAKTGIPLFSILERSNVQNPVRDWSVVFMPYCDGSFFAGDIDIDVDGDGVIDRYHRGLKNLSAGLDTAVRTFPAPSKILLAGSSAGGFGTAYALPLVRYLYPQSRIYVINDSGIGIFPPINQAMTDWGARKFLPDSCVDCVNDNGNLTGYHAWQLKQDQNMLLGMMSFTEDSVIAETYSDLGVEQFETQLRTELAAIEKAYQSRMHCFIADDDAHTFLVNDLLVTVQGMTASQWIEAMLSDSLDWVTVAQ